MKYCEIDYATRYSALFVLSLLAAGGCEMTDSEVETPSIIFGNGKIITMNDNDAIAEAVAVRGESAGPSLPCVNCRWAYRR